MRIPPPDVVASWPTPNYVDPETRGPALLITVLIIMPIALVTLVCRLYVRMYMLRRAGWDDWLMIAATIGAVGVTICTILATQTYGWDKHIWDLTTEEIVKGRQISIALQTIFIFAAGLAKTSILCSYLRIAPLDSWFRRLTYATIVLVIAVMVVFTIVLWTQCSPVSSYWDLVNFQRDCLPEGPPLLAQTIITVITDFLVFVLPLPTLLCLRLPIVQRIVLFILFGVGAVVVISSCMRAYWVHDVVDSTYDVTWQGWELWIWTAVEINLGIIAGCVPLLKPLLSSSSRRERAHFYGKRHGKQYNVRRESAGSSAHTRSRSNKTDDGESGIFRADSARSDHLRHELIRIPSPALSLPAKEIYETFEIKPGDART